MATSDVSTGDSGRHPLRLGLLGPSRETSHHGQLRRLPAWSRLATDPTRQDLVFRTARLRRGVLG
eukprot:11299598-Alexandrium_andersonii.AAC.1